ncbi:MAG: hypothetical protein Q9207_003665 [Kuettlingeria erythrocarpa]
MNSHSPRSSLKLHKWLRLYDVVHGESHVEGNRTSLLNYANAEAISDLIDKFLAAGIPSRSIVVLTMYKAQLKLLILKIARTEDGQLKYRLISTTDAFQGQEGSVVIMDLVVAKYYGNYKVNEKSGLSFEKAEASETIDPLAAVGQTYSNVTTFARDYHRICVALTRAINGLVVVGQVARLLTSLIKFHDPLANTLHALAADALERGLVAADKTHVDTHPKSQQRHEDIKKRQENQILAAKEDAERHAFYQSFVKFGRAKVAAKESASVRAPGLAKGKGQGSADGQQPPGKQQQQPLPPAGPWSVADRSKEPPPQW